MTRAALSSATQLMIRLHELNHVGKGDSSETAETMGQLEMLWRTLDPRDRERLDGLSGDLYLLVDDELLVALPEGQTPENVQTGAGTAIKSHDFDRVLELLRFGPPRMPDVGISYLRSRCYEQLGMHAAALAFMDHAARL